MTEPGGMSQEAKVVVKSYGSWTQFMHSFGLKPWEDNDAKEGLAIAESFAKDAEEGKSGSI